MGGHTHGGRPRGQSSRDLSNEEYGRLAQAALLGGDADATATIEAYLDWKIAPKLDAVSSWLRPDLEWRLKDAAYRATFRAVERGYERPRNYAMAAVRHKFCDFLKTKYRLNTPFDSPALEEIAQAIDDPEIEEVASRAAVDRVLRSMRDEAISVAARKVQQVIETAYELNMTWAESCEVLNFGDETESVLRNVRRWRGRNARRFEELIRDEEVR